MQLLFLVLNKTECLEDLLTELYDNGLCGATIVDSHGMAQSLSEMGDFQFLGSLRYLLNPEHTQNKTIFMALQEEQLPLVSQIVNRVTGGLKNADTGVMFAVPISYTEGLEH